MHVTRMGIFVIYTVVSIIISPRFQFFSNKNIGNVILFALQINHPDSLLNICINLKYYKAFARINQAPGCHCPSAGSPRSGPFMSTRSPKRGFPYSLPGSLLSPLYGHVSAVRSAPTAYSFLEIQRSNDLGHRSSVPGFLFYLIRNYCSGVTHGHQLGRETLSAAQGAPGEARLGSTEVFVGGLGVCWGGDGGHQWGSWPRGQGSQGASSGQTPSWVAWGDSAGPLAMVGDTWVMGGSGPTSLGGRRRWGSPIAREKGGSLGPWLCPHVLPPPLADVSAPGRLDNAASGLMTAQ